MNGLTVRSLRVERNGVAAVRDVDIDVSAGEIVALLGANGAGKSSLLLALAGLVRSHGSVALDGVDLTLRSTRSRVQAGLVLVPERRAIFPRLTVAENLAVGEYVHARDANLAEDRGFVDAVFPQLVPLAHRQAGTLSGGERQMLALAKALLARPRILLVDELSLGLAPKVVAAMFHVIGTLRGRGIGILLVEQHVHRALELADRAYILGKGHVVASGDADTLQTDGAALASTYLGGARRRNAPRRVVDRAHPALS